MAAERVIIGKNCQIKIIYDNVPQTFRIEAFNESDEAELRMRDFLGQDTPEPDYIEKGFTGDGMVLDAGVRLDRIAEDMKRRRRANLPPADLQITLTKVYRDGATLPRLVQVDPDYVFRSADRGKPELSTFDAPAFGLAGAIPVWPVSASHCVADLTMPELRYIVDPAKPPLTSVEHL